MKSVDVVGSTWIDGDGIEVKFKEVNAYSVYFDWLNHPLFGSDRAADRMSITGFKARFKRKPSVKPPFMPKIGSKWLRDSTNEEVTVTAVDDNKEDRPPCVWFDLENGCASLLSVHRFRERFTQCFTLPVEDETKTFKPLPSATLPPKAVQILTEAVEVMAERGKSYDKSGGQAERSMPKIVEMFNALTGHDLTPEQGWKFMACLKLARSEQGEHREDNYLDGAAYFALAGEEAEASEVSK